MGENAAEQIFGGIGKEWLARFFGALMEQRFGYFNNVCLDRVTRSNLPENIPVVLSGRAGCLRIIANHDIAGFVELPAIVAFGVKNNHGIAVGHGTLDLGQN